MMFDLTRLQRRLRIARELGYRRIAGALAYQVGLKARRVDLASESVEHLGLEPASANRHDASNPVPIEYAFTKLKLTGRVTSVLDVGCGKGGALLAFHRLGVPRLAGFDASSRLVEICQENLRRTHVVADVWTQNASTFDEFGRYDLFYLFNPFPRAVLAPFLDRMVRFVARTGIGRLILFRHPQDEDLFHRSGFSIVQTLDEPVRTLLIDVTPP